MQPNIADFTPIKGHYLRCWDGLSRVLGERESIFVIALSSDLMLYSDEEGESPTSMIRFTSPSNIEVATLKALPVSFHSRNDQN